MPASPLVDESAAAFAAWPQTWRAQALVAPPLIAPARQFTYPRQIAGEEDALARGALQLLVTPADGGAFLATCALGFTSEAMPTAVFACPNHDELCAVAGGYAYLIDTTKPDRSTLLPLKPVVELRVWHSPNATHDLLLFIGFHSILAWGADGLAWQSSRLSWEGIRLENISSEELTGLGWDLRTDRELPFTLDLRTGIHTGGGFQI